MGDNVVPEIIRGDVGNEEATRDPIFLFQRKRITWSQLALPEGFEFDDDFNITDASDEYVAEDDPRLFKNGNIGFYWDTESVFFTREEGEAWGRSKSYNYKFGWRVYCVCAEGSLAALLRAHSLQPTGSVKEG